MKRDTAAPRGISPDSIPTLKAYVANKCVVSIGHHLVKTLTISKFAKVTIIENNIVIEIIFFIIGRVI